MQSSMPAINHKIVADFKIPLPPFEVQEQIVAELDGYQKIIDGAKQIVENYKPTIKIDPEWEMVELGEVCDVKSGGTPSKTNKEYRENGNIPRLRSECCKDGYVYEAKDFITEEGLNNSSAKYLEKGTTLIALVGATIGKTGYLEFKSTTNQNIAGLYPKNNAILSNKYLFFVTQTLYDKFIKLGDGNFTMANLSFVKGLKIPLPSLEVQKQIVAEIEKEQAMVDSAKGLIEVFEGKVKEKIGEVWGE